MKFLPHVERSIQRHGYIKPEYATDLAIMMEELEGSHPHKIARAFRQRGTPLPKETKKLLGIRSNADMTAEAMDALTQKGLSEPMKGFEITLLDASFDYFRHGAAKSLAGTEVEKYATYHINRAWPDCAGCLRLDGTEIDPNNLGTLPPPDCARDTCAIGITPRVDFIQQALDLDKRRPSHTMKKKKGWLNRLFDR